MLAFTCAVGFSGIARVAVLADFSGFHHPNDSPNPQNKKSLFEP
jgi:hypothetical protein